jgi:acetyl/propionyl-CoA carboxylase alpha subunit
MQIKVARGEALTINKKTLQMADMELRVYAEDPLNDFTKCWSS